MGDGTEPRGDDLIGLADELYAARQKIARLEAEITALREAWAQVSNDDRHDLMAGMESLLSNFFKKCSARRAFDAQREAGKGFFLAGAPAARPSLSETAPLGVSDGPLPKSIGGDGR